MNSRSTKHQQKALAEELLKGFHVQFAENQRTREQSFLKIVGFLGAVVLGYAYVYQNLSADLQAFSLTALTAITLLAFGAAIVTVIAYNFRRDQYVNARIRRIAGIIGPSDPFPPDFDPAHLYEKSNKGFLWMPDIFNIFYMIFPIFQLLLLISFALKTRLSLAHAFDEINWLASLVFVLSLLAIAFSLFVSCYYSKKLKRKIRKWEMEHSSGKLVSSI